LGSQVPHSQAVFFGAWRDRPITSALAVSAGSWAHLLLGFLFLGIPDSRADRSPGNSACRQLSSGSGSITRWTQPLLVRAFAAMDLKQFGHAAEHLLDRNHRVCASDPELLAAWNAD